MLILVAVLVVFNLCLGYALGAYFGGERGLPTLRLPARRRPQEEPLVQPVAAAVESPTAPASPKKKAPAPRPAEPEIEDAQLLSGLAAFQEQLAQMGQELTESQDDAEAFDTAAKNIQEANHAYLESTHEQLGQLPDEHRLRESMEEGAKQLGKISDEFDAIVGDGLEDDEARAKLVDKSSELNDTVAEVRQTQEETRAAVADAAGAAGLAKLDDLLEQLDTVLQDEGESAFRAAVLVRQDAIQADGEDPTPDVVEERLITKLAEMLTTSLPGVEHVAYRDDSQFLMILEQGDLDSMTERVDQLRQQIAETTFSNAGVGFRTTLTCAIADVPGAESRDEVIGRLDEAMAESNRFGANRTFHHDGKFPTPVPPADVEIEPQTVEL